MAKIDKQQRIKDANAIPLEKWKRETEGSSIMYTAGVFRLNRFFEITPDEMYGPIHSLTHNGQTIAEDSRYDLCWLFRIFNPAYWLFRRLERHHDNPA